MILFESQMPYERTRFGPRPRVLRTRPRRNGNPRDAGHIRGFVRIDVAVIRLARSQDQRAVRSDGHRVLGVCPRDPSLLRSVQPSASV